MTKRKATFTKTDNGLYKPVNKLANLITEGDVVDAGVLKAIAGLSYAKPYIWTDHGLRQSFRG